MMKTENEYFNFLCKIVDKTNVYSSLLRYLHTVEFYSLVPNDDNRAADGEQLRDLFIDEVGPTEAPSFPLFQCSVFEMLIGLSNRLEFELLGGKYERSAREWFWVLIENLDLMWCTNTELSNPNNYEELELAIQRLVTRQYDTDGNGGLFPLNNPEKDQRRIEIWYQMSFWINENYPI